jgi:hypothetical protein
VPRDLRRRTASHDARRLPQKLRERAAKEVSFYIFVFVRMHVDSVDHMHYLDS